MATLDDYPQAISKFESESVVASSSFPMKLYGPTGAARWQLTAWSRDLR